MEALVCDLGAFNEIGRVGLNESVVTAFDFLADNGTRSSVELRGMRFELGKILFGR